MKSRSVLVVVESKDGNSYDKCEAYEVVDREEATNIPSYRDRDIQTLTFCRTIHMHVSDDMSVKVLADEVTFRAGSLPVDDNYGQQLIWDIDTAFNAFDVARAAAFPTEYRKWEGRRAADSHKIGEDEKTPVEIVLPVQEQTTFPYIHEERG